MEDKLEEPTVIQAGEHSMVWDGEGSGTFSCLWCGIKLRDCEEFSPECKGFSREGT